MSIADKFNKLINTKAAIKAAIIDKGVDVSDDTKFADYPAKISAIESGGGDSYYEDLFNVRTDDRQHYQYLFAQSSAKTLDLGNLKTSNVTDMNHMFYFCTKLTSLDLSNFNTSNVTDMGYMFYYCQILAQLDVSNFNTSNVTDMGYMFQGCSGLTSLNLSNFNTSNVTTMYSMFNNCSSLIQLDLSNFDTSKVTNMNGMFSGCKSLTTLNLSSFDISKCTSSSSCSSTFHNCTALTDFQAPKNISAPFNFSTCLNLTHDSLMSILNNLITTSTTIKLTLGATNLAKLSDEEKAIATNKGWTLA